MRRAPIYIAPGQEKYLPHEAWHVVQQKQERVIKFGRIISSRLSFSTIYE